MRDCSAKPKSQDPSMVGRVERVGRAIEAALVSQSKAQYAEAEYPVITLDGVYELDKISRAAIAAYTFVEKFCAAGIVARAGGNPWRQLIRELLG